MWNIVLLSFITIIAIITIIKFKFYNKVVEVIIKLKKEIKTVCSMEGYTFKFFLILNAVSIILNSELKKLQLNPIIALVLLYSSALMLGYMFYRYNVRKIKGKPNFYDGIIFIMIYFSITTIVFVCSCLLNDIFINFHIHNLILCTCLNFIVSLILNINLTVVLIEYMPKFKNTLYIK